MSRKILARIRKRRATESGSKQHPWQGRYRVALIYPNTYRNGMSNLGLQTVCQLINQWSDCLCERFFLPDAEDIKEHQQTGALLLSYESQRPIRDFDLVALSVSFENDYLNLPLIFSLANLPLFAADRTPLDPLVLLGGVCAFLNPEPLAEVVDLVAVGEAEPILPALLSELTDAAKIPAAERSALVAKLAAIPGVYLPGKYEINYTEEGRVASINAVAPAPQTVRRQYLRELDQGKSRSFIQAEETEFGDMALLEVSRGCTHGCRFCAAGFIYLPPRERSLDNLLTQVDDGLCQRQKLGLVGAAVADHPQIEALQQEILARGGEFSVSSLRLDALTAEEVVGLRDSGLKTAAIAPEAGSQRLRELINKGLNEQQILQAVQLLADGDIRNLKLYFLIGLPTETQADLDELLRLTDRIRLLWKQAGQRRGQMGRVTLSVNPFIPKPFTPLQWVGMEPENSLKKKLRYLYSAISRMPNTELQSESIRAAVLQAFLARGDRRVGSLLPQLADGGNLKQLCKKAGLSVDFYVSRERDAEEIFPWEIIDQGFSKDYLWQDYQAALAGKSTPPCVTGCTRCGVCASG